MASKIILLGIFLINFQAWAGAPPRFTGCGEYSVRGRLEIIDGKPHLIVFKGSTGQTDLLVTGTDPIQAYRYPGKTIDVSGEIFESIRSFRGSIKARSISRSYSNPLDAHQGQGFFLSKRNACTR
jgi:hypothetical protein